MSKVFKLEQCVETFPCKVEPAKLEIPVVPFPDEAGEPLADESQLRNTTAQAQVKAESILAQAKIKAEKILEDARNEAEAILRTARQEAEDLKEESRRLAFSEGREAGLNAIRMEMSDHLSKAVALLNETEIIREQRIASSEPEIIKLAVAIAEKIVAAELRLDTDAIRNIIGNALAKVAGATRIKIRVHPDDLEALSSNARLNFEEVLNDPKPLHFEADPGMTQGGCYIETELGNVDARVKLQLEKIMTELLKVGQLA